MKNFCLLLLLVLYGCTPLRQQGYHSSNLVIEEITDGVYQHTSYLDVEGYGKFGCNGLVWIHNQQALVFDTPTTHESAEELLKWIKETMKAEVNGVVINHFHNDCLGSLSVFHQQNIPSHANWMTIKRAQLEGYTLPQQPFQKELELYLDNQKAITRYFGRAHTEDNVVSYLSNQKVLFGGCMIKANGAGKGNLADAHPEEWPETVKAVQKAYPQAKYVIPGHGAAGDASLFSYTIDLFSN